mmetsp:Transcript_26160/g.26591  ORF Transcript_26160/g.26591 Transcript_26160/m.26591 type:complete len:333 (-) Transcript_26160:69-1067(-)
MSKKDVYDALSSLTEVLSVREKELDAREEELRKLEEKIEIDRSTFYDGTSPSDVLHLNIGGTKTTILRRTLTSVPGSMLASRFSGRWDDGLEKDKHGDFFIDQEYVLFECMLHYLRNKANGIEKYPIPAPSVEYREYIDRRVDFCRMVDYYGMTDGLFPVALNMHTGSEDSAGIIGPKKVNAKEWTTFILNREGHDRSIKSYEVTLGDVKDIKIGWYYKPAKFTTSTNVNLGPGDVNGTVGLDLERSKFMVNGECIQEAEGLVYTNGTVVRAEDYGKVWYVNGEIVAPTSKEVVEKLDLTYKDGYNRPTVYVMRPLISIKGEMEITSIELEN